MTRMFLKTLDSDLESPDLILSLKYIKWLLSIEVLTFRDFEVISWVISYWNILKWRLSDHLPWVSNYFPPPWFQEGLLDR